MKRLALALTGLTLVAGCQLQTIAPSSRQAEVAMPQAAAPETVLADVRLGDTRVTTLKSDVRDRVVDDMRFRAAEAGNTGGEVQVRITTIAELKAQHAFAHSYLSDDSQVVLATSEGRFEVADAEGGAQSRKVYAKLMGMFDPVTGETLGLGYLP